MQSIFLKSRKVSTVTKVIGLLGFIALCVACLANPLVALAGNNPNSVVLIHDYGSINQLSVMPNGQLAMKLKPDSTLHGVNRKLASPNACTTSDAHESNETSDDEDGNETPEAKDANETPEADDICTQGTATPNKVAVLSSQMLAGHILAVQFGTSQAVCISLPKGQCLMPDGEIIDLKS